MTRKNTSIGPLNTEPRLTDTANCEGESVSVPSLTPRSFRSYRMSTNTSQHNRNYGSRARQTRQNGTSATEVTMLTGVVA